MSNKFSQSTKSRIYGYSAAFIIIVALAVVFTSIAVFAQSYEHPDNGLEVTTENGKWNVDGRNYYGEATGLAAVNNDQPAVAETATLTFKNTGAAAAMLAFSYEKPTLGSGGSVKIDGTRVTAAGAFTKALAPGEETTVVIVSGSPGAYVSSIFIGDVRLLSDRQTTVTFTPAMSGGSYKVNGTTVSAEQSMTQSSYTAYQLTAVPESGYKLMGWYGSVDGYLADTTTYSARLDKDQTVTAVFTAAADPVFDVNGNLFNELTAAINYSVSANVEVIRLRSGGTLPAGNYTIPAGKILLIPFNAINSVNITEPARVDTANATAQSLFRKLTLPADAVINVNGTIEVGAKINSKNNGYTGCTTGKYGQIELLEGSLISVKSGGKVVCWGYITGDGEIIAESGSSVTEPFNVCDLRGGSATSAMLGNSKLVFPFTQYYIQNIEASLTIQSGAIDYAYGNVTIWNIAMNLSVPFVGTSGSLFNLSSGSSFTKKYDIATGRNIIDVYGDASLDSMTISLASNANIVSSQYYMPLMENITINLHSGTTTVNQHLCLLPGFRMNIDEGATIELAEQKRIMIYDRDEWVGKKFVYGGVDFLPPLYSPSCDAHSSVTEDDLVDVVIDLNGTIKATGFIYTTQSGAAVISSKGTGKLTWVKKPSDTSINKTYQVVQTGTAVEYIEIPVTVAKLLNEDGSYTESTIATKKNSTFYFCTACGRWDLTKNSTAHNHYKITWENYDGSVLYTEVVNKNVVPAYSGETPVKEPDAQYTYEFAGWTPEIVAATANATYTAVFNPVVKTFTITWNNWDGTPLEVDENVPYGQMPSYDAEMPQKAADSKFEYRFTSWYKVPSEATQDAVYTAVFYAEEIGSENAAIADDLGFAYRSVTLRDSISFKYKVNKNVVDELGYTNLRAIVTLNNKGTLISNGVVDGNLIVFEFRNVNPQYMSTLQYAVLFAEKNGVTYKSAVIEGSIENYCMNLLNNYTGSEYAKMRTVIVDLLNFGSSTQIYQQFRVDDLANGRLSPEQAAQGTQTMPKMESYYNDLGDVSSPTVIWKGQGLRIQDSIFIRYKIEASDITGLYLKVTADDGRVWTIASSRFEPVQGAENQYYVIFDKLIFSEMRTVVSAAVFDSNDNQLSTTRVYSIETYAALCCGSDQPAYTEALKNVLIDMMRMGDSAKAFAS